MRSAILLAVAAAANAAPAAAADAPPPVRVVTFDGRVLPGDALVPAGGSLELRAGEATTAIPVAEVLEAVFEVPAFPDAAVPGALAVDVALVNRDRIPGTLARGEGEQGFVVRSRSLGEVAIPLDLVASVRFPAAWSRVPDPPALATGGREDCFLFLSGDRLDGTLRSVSAEEVRVRSSSGEDRTIRTDQLLGFALAALPPKPAAGLRVQVALADGTLLTGSGIAGDATRWTLPGTPDGRERSFPTALVAGFSVRGGAGTCLSDLEPETVEVRPFWGDDPPVLPFRPVVDRAFTLDPGAPPPIRLGGRTWLRGISMFSGTTATWSLEGRGFRSFSAAVGVDDAGPRGRVEFEVLLDGKSAWRSPALGTVAPGGEPTAIPPLEIAGAKTISLRVHAGPGDDVQDFADWVRPVLRP
jgi:hypothetical protein